MIINWKPLKYLFRIATVFYICFFVFVFSLIIMDAKSCGFFWSRFDPGVMKLYVDYQAVTGPSISIAENDSSVRDLIIKKYGKDINTQEAELTGDNPFRTVDDPAEIGDTNVYGYFSGTTDKYKITGDGVVPVFNVKYYDDPAKVLVREIFGLPVAYIIFYSLPVIIIMTVIYVVKGVSAVVRRIRNRVRG